MAPRRAGDDLEKIAKEGFEMIEMHLQAEKARQAEAARVKPKAKVNFIIDREAAKRAGGIHFVVFRPPKSKA